MTQGDCFDESELGTWRSFLGTHARLVSQIDRELIERHELSLVEYEIMAHLDQAPNGQLRMRELALVCGLSASGLTRRFDSMARAGFVSRRKCCDDRRGVFAELSALGHTRLVDASPAYLDAVRRAFADPLGDRGQDLLVDLMDRLGQEASPAALGR